MSLETVRVEERGGALWLSLDRPPLNVLDLPTIRAIADVVMRLPARSDLKVLVLRSAVGGVFSAGVEVRDHARERVGLMLSAFHALFRLLDGLPLATVAAVDGHCLGGGCELAAFCDVVLATPRSSFGQPEIDVGCFPPVAASLLPRLVGRAAFEIVLSGAPIAAAEAVRIGLITRVVDDLDAETEVCVARLTGKSRAVLALARKALRHGRDESFREALAHNERLYREDLAATEDIEEGVRAFLEKRTPRWRDA